MKKNHSEKFFVFFTAGIIVPSSVNLSCPHASLYIPKSPDVLNNITFHWTSFDTTGEPSSSLL